MYQNYSRIISEKGITSYKVSKGTGISQATFSYWKNGKQKPKVDKLLKIADFLNVTLDELVKET